MNSMNALNMCNSKIYSKNDKIYSKNDKNVKDLLQKPSGKYEYIVS